MEEPKPTEEQQELAGDLLLVDNFCRTNDIDIEAVAEYLMNKRSPWIKITPETMPEVNTKILCQTIDGRIFRARFFQSGKGEPIFFSNETAHVTKYPYKNIARHMPIPPIPEK